jgi:hypothetical protein
LIDSLAILTKADIPQLLLHDAKVPWYQPLGGNVKVFVDKKAIYEEILLSAHGAFVPGLPDSTNTAAGRHIQN